MNPWFETALARFLTMRSGGLRHISPPAAEGRNVLCAADVGGLHDEAFHAASVLQANGADRERRRNSCNEFGEFSCPQRPYFKCDGCAATGLDAQHPRLGWRGG